MNIPHLELPRRFGSSRPSSQDGFDLHAIQHLNELQSFLESSNTPQASIHVEVDGKIQKKTLLGRQSRYPSVARLSQDQSRSPLSSASQAPSEVGVINTTHTSLEANIKEAEAGANTVYAIASYTKILVNVTYRRLISDGRYKDLGLSWDKSACDLFNEVRRAKRKTGIRRFSRDPNIRELLLHRNGFAPMNRFLFAPDGTFIVSEDEFLERAPLITEYHFKGGKQGWSVYSNANHIFAGIVLEAIAGKNLHDIMQDILFNPLRMTHTVVDKQSLDNLEKTGCIIAEGHRVSGDMSQSTALPQRRYLTDTVEMASLGARSSTEDLAKLIREFLKALDGMSSEFQENDILDFFGPKNDLHNGSKVALGGLLCGLDTILPGSESLNRVLVPSDEVSPYTLGKRPSGAQCNVYYKAGSIDGFASTVYISLKQRAFVIVLANSTGPVDVTDHIARYILQEALDLSPRVNIFSRATQEGIIASEKVQTFEGVDTDLSRWSDNVQDLAGKYRHVRLGQELEITKEGDVILRGRDKPSSLMKARVSGITVRIFPGLEGFGIERWSVWDDLIFTMEHLSGKTFLIGNKEDDRYERISVL